MDYDTILHKAAVGSLSKTELKQYLARTLDIIDGMSYEQAAGHIVEDLTELGIIGLPD